MEPTRGLPRQGAPLRPSYILGPPETRGPIMGVPIHTRIIICLVSTSRDSQKPEALCQAGAPSFSQLFAGRGAGMRCGAILGTGLFLRL